MAMSGSAIARDDVPLIRECLHRGLKRDEYDILVIEPQSPEPEEVDYPSAGTTHEDDRPPAVLREDAQRSGRPTASLWSSRSRSS